MALQIVAVNDAAPGACQDVGMTWNGSTTLTSSRIIAGTSCTMSGTLAVTGNVAVNTDKFTVTAASGNTLVAGTLAVTGAPTFTGNATCSGTLTVDGASTLTGATTQTGILTCADDIIGGASSDIAINTNKFTVAAGTGNTVIAGTGTITGASTFTGAQALVGNTTHTGTIIGGAATDITLNTNKFTVDATNGNTLIAGTAEVTGTMAQTGIATFAAACLFGATADSAAHGAVAIDITEMVTLVSSDGDSDQDATLADGGDGQLKIIKMEADGGNDFVLTPANFRDGSTIKLSSANEVMVLAFCDSTWNLVYTDGTVA